MAVGAEATTAAVGGSAGCAAFAGCGARIGVHLPAVDLERSIQRHAEWEELSGDHEARDRITEPIPRAAILRADARHPIVVSAHADRVGSVRISQYAVMSSDGRCVFAGAGAAALVVHAGTVRIDLTLFRAAALNCTIATQGAPYADARKTFIGGGTRLLVVAGGARCGKGV